MSGMSRRVALEQRRIVSGSFPVISIFYQEDENANAAIIDEMELSDILVRRPTMEEITKNGWKVTTLKSCIVNARPTTTCVVMEMASIDALPISETTLVWSVVLAV